MLISSLCRADDFFTPWFEKWASRLELPGAALPAERRKLRRKHWEWAAICQALDERGMLKRGKRAMGFAVGREKLPSLFASYGVQVLASDIGDDGISATWKSTGQYAGNLDDLFFSSLIDWRDFEERVSYRHVDMRDLSRFETSSLDFLWSSCSFEHLGSLEAGTRFVLESTKLLKPGGVAVHTTEFNLSSNTETTENGEIAIYRQCDILRLRNALAADGVRLARLDFNPGDHEFDRKHDFLPWTKDGRQHVKLLLGPYVCTSILLIIEKPPEPTRIARLLRRFKNPSFL